MTPSRPYLVRALYEWIVDNELTPHVLVDATAPGVQVPTQFVENDQIVLNISPFAVQGLNITNEAMEFGARFGGAAMQVYAPTVAIRAIYARENGRGMVFAEEEGLEPPPEAPPDPPDPPPAGKRPALRVVK